MMTKTTSKIENNLKPKQHPNFK